MTHNPWQHGRTPGGSSGGIGGGGRRRAGHASPRAGDGGGSIRIPAGFTGLFGLKATLGRIPLSAAAPIGQLSRSRSAACRARCATRRAGSTSCNGHDPRDPFSLPRVDGWEAGLGSPRRRTARARVAVVADWGGAVVSPAMWDVLEARRRHADRRPPDCVRVDGVDTSLPRMGAAWSVISGGIGRSSAARRRSGLIAPTC